MDASPGILLEHLLADGAEGCQNCYAFPPENFEISRLIEVDGELHETRLVALLHYCEGCLALLVARNWSALDRRRTSS